MDIDPVQPGELPQNITASQIFDKVKELDAAIVTSPVDKLLASRPLAAKSSAASAPQPMIPAPPPPTADSDPRGFFVPCIKSALTRMQCRSNKLFMYLIMNSYKEGKPRTDCEILNKVAVSDCKDGGVLSQFKATATPVKPFFDFDMVLPYEPDEEYVVDMVTSWQLQVYDILKPFYPTLDLDFILPASRHRPYCDGGFKVSARFFVKGARTTMKDLEDIITHAKSDGTVYTMDMSVYSTIRKMSMVFCVKDRANADDSHCLLPGMLAKDADDIVQDPSFDPLDYVIQNVKGSDFLITPPACSSNKRPKLHTLQPSKKKSRNLVFDDDDESDDDDAGPSVKNTFTMLAPVLEAIGFKNPRQDGESVSNGHTTVFNFKCDDQDDCPLCHGNHTSNRWYCVLGKHLVVSNHSENCSPPDTNADISLIRPSSTLMKVLAKVGTSRHHDYAYHFKEECKGEVMYDELDKSFYAFDGVQWKSIGEQQVHMQMFKYLARLMQKEVDELQQLNDMLKPLQTAESKKLVADQLKIAKTAYCNVGKTDFQRSVLAQVKMLMCVPESIQWDGKPGQIHFTNGCLELATGNFRPTLLEDYNRNTVGYDYEMDGWEQALPLWEDCVKTILPKEDIRRLFKMFVGLCLTGYTNIKKIFCLCDMKEGHNGKSFIMKLVSLMLGDYSWTPNRNMIARTRSSSAEAPANFLMALRGKRLFVNEEMGEAQLDTALLKEWTSGVNDLRITARKNFSDPVTWVAFFKIALTANRGKLNFDTTDPAFRKRLLTIPFEVTFVNVGAVRPPYYMAENKSHADFLLKHVPLRAAMIHWALDGYKDIMTNSHLLDDEQLPKSMFKFKNEVVLYNDPAMNLIHDLIIFTDNPEDQVMPAEVWRQYRATPKCPRNTKEKDFLATLKLFVQQNHADAWFVHASVPLVKYHKYRYSSVGMSFQ